LETKLGGRHIGKPLSFVPVSPPVAIDTITDIRYIIGEETQMDLNNFLKEKHMTKYQLSKNSGVPFTTISEITTGKTKIRNCTGATLYKLAKAMDVAIEDLLSDSMEYRPAFETFKSNVCHMVKDMGDLGFIIDILEADKIRKLYQREWYPESLYLLAMVDYLCRENDLPVCAEYSELRAARLEKPIYPAGIITMCYFAKSDQPKIDSYNDAIPEFKRFNIVENEIRNVC